MASAVETNMVQGLREIVNCPEAEILAALRECGMDPDQALNRLLTQDTFHEVKSKREKKKEIKEIPDSRSRTVNNTSIRGTRIAADRGEKSSLYHSRLNDSIGQKTSALGHGQSVVNSEKPVFSSSSLNNDIATNGLHAPLRPSSGSQSSSTMPGHRSMADIVKMGRPQVNATNKPNGLVDRSYVEQYPAISSSADQIIRHASIPIMQPNHDWEHPVTDDKYEQLYTSDDHQSYQTQLSKLDEHFSEHQLAPSGSSSISVSQSHPIEASTVHDIVEIHDNARYEEITSEDQDLDYRIRLQVETSQPYSKFNDAEFRRADDYEAQTHHFEHNEDEDDHVDVPSAASDLSLRNKEQDSENVANVHPAVIIPDHLQVTNTGCEHLSFGSFGSGAFSCLLPSRVSKNTDEAVPVAEESSSVDKLDDRNQENYNADSVSYSAEDVRDADALQFNLPSVSKHGYLNDNQPNNSDLQQGNAQLQNMSHVSSMRQSSSLIDSLSTSDAPPLRDFDLSFSPLITSQSLGHKYSSSVPPASCSGILNQNLKSAAEFVNASQTQQSTSMPSGPPLPQPLALHQYSQPAVPLGPFSNLVGYSYMTPGYTCLPPTAIQQAYSSNGPFNQSASVSSNSMKYSLPTNYKGSISSENLIQPSTFSGYRGFGTSNNLPVNLSLNPSAASVAMNIGLNEALAAHYKDYNQYMSLQQHGDSSAMWLNALGSRAAPALPSNNFYGYQGQSQHNNFRVGQQSSQYGSNVGYPNFYHLQADAMKEHSRNPSQSGMVGSQAASSQPSHELWQRSY